MAAGQDPAEVAAVQTELLFVQGPDHGSSFARLVGHTHKRGLQDIGSINRRRQPPDRRVEYLFYSEGKRTGP